MPDPNDEAQDLNEGRREPYQAPQLKALGSITELTQSVAGTPGDNGQEPGSQL